MSSKIRFIIFFLILLTVLVTILTKCFTGFVYDTSRIIVKVEKINENQINITGNVVDSYTKIKSYSYRIKKKRLYIKFRGALVIGNEDKEDILGNISFNILVNDKDYDEVILDGGFNDKKLIMKKY